MCLDDISASITLCKCRLWGRAAPESHSDPLIDCVCGDGRAGSSAGVMTACHPEEGLDQGRWGREPALGQWGEGVGGSTSVPEVRMSSAPCTPYPFQANWSWMWAAGCGLLLRAVKNSSRQGAATVGLVDSELSPSGEQAGCPLPEHSAPWKLGKLNASLRVRWGS